eukprot:7843082-Pyramimonas_sp.AAC.2
MRRTRVRRRRRGRRGKQRVGAGRQGDLLDGAAGPERHRPRGPPVQVLDLPHQRVDETEHRCQERRHVQHEHRARSEERGGGRNWGEERISEASST